ncbi:MAG: UPF0280 family protein [Candidatus Methanomethylophilaceae archaeon]
MNRIHFEVGETAVTIISEADHLRIAKDAIFDARETIKAKIQEDPYFGTSFEPIVAEDSDDDLIRRMCDASVLAGVGPMAGVAGAVAVHAVERMSIAGARYAIVENGGDIALVTDRETRVGLFTNDSNFENLAFRIPRTGTIKGICSSSGLVGPSVSFGNSGICTVFSDDVILADACATALGNLVVKGESEEMSYALETIGNIAGVSGCAVCCNGLFAVYGEIPELVRSKVSIGDVSKIEFSQF